MECFIFMYINVGYLGTFSEWYMHWMFITIINIMKSVEDINFIWLLSFKPPIKITKCFDHGTQLHILGFAL